MIRLLLLAFLLLLATTAHGALTGTNRGSGGTSGAATTFNLSPTSNYSGATGAWAVLVVGLDNSHALGTAYTTLTVTDGLSNTWTAQQVPLNDPGAASAGITGAIFTTPMAGGVLQTSTTITITVDTSNARWNWQLYEINTSGTISYVTGATGTSGTTTTSPTITTGSIASGDMVIAALMVEAGTTETITADADSSDGSWSTQQVNYLGVTTSGVDVASQWKVVTGTNTQTYNPTLTLGATDLALGWIQLHETVSGPTAQQKAAFFQLFP